MKIPDGWNVSENFKELPGALRQLILSGASFWTFDYSLDEWRQIKLSLQPLNADENAVEDCCEKLQGAARSYFHEILSKPSRQTEQKRQQQCWTKVRKHSEALLSEVSWLAKAGITNGPPPPPGYERYKPYGEEQLVLKRIHSMAQSRLDSFGLKCNDYPAATPKALYQYEVLSVWIKLSGKLKISRHPTTGKIKGPLVRYFSAVTQPVHGGSPESLPDIIERYTAYKVASKKWLMEMDLGDDDP
jgi:hypothetical protein